MQHKQELDRLSGVLKDEDSEFQEEFISAQQQFNYDEVGVIAYILFSSSY